MPKVLIVYPHGLGDCILATPAIREYKKQTGNFIGFAMLERFRSAELFKNNPYVDEIIYITDPWNDYPSFNEGMCAIMKYCQQYADDNGYDQVKGIQHSPDGSKIKDCYESLRIFSNGDLHTEVYLTDEDHEWAKKANGIMPKFGFIHAKTGVPNKDLPIGYGSGWIQKNFGRLSSIFYLIEVDKVEPITRGFALMNLADVVVVTDSVYYHAAGAMDKDVDLAYFARGKSVYDRVKPLHPVKQNIVYELEDLSKF